MSRFKIFSTSFAVLALMACGQASSVDVASAQNDTQSATDMSWTVVQDESHLKFTAKQEGKPFTGEFGSFDADIKFDPDNLEASTVSVTIPLAQVDAGTRDRNSTLPDNVWFSTKKFPEAVFESSDISSVGGNDYLAKGTLTLKGISKDLDLPFSLDITDQAVMTSNVTLDRTLWNVGEDPWNTDEWVSQAVELDIKVVAIR